MTLPEGQQTCLPKIHLFTLANTTSNITSGNKIIYINPPAFDPNHYAVCYI